MSHALVLSLALGGFSAQAQWRDAELAWKLKRERNGIQIFLSKVPGSKFQAVLSKMKLKATPRELAALVMDLDNCSKWAAMCRSATLIERLSDSEAILHSVNNAPFPVKDRDVVAQIKWSYDSNTGALLMQSEATPDKLPKRKGVVRVEYASSEWHFTPLKNGVVLVENYAHVDPNGSVPAWLTNLLIEDSPYKTLFNMRKLILNGDYINSDTSFIPAYSPRRLTVESVDKSQF